MKSLSLCIFIFGVLVKSISSFSCEDVFLDSKENLYKATTEKIVETKVVYSNAVEYNTWYIDPCRSVEKQPKDSDKGHCPNNSKVCLVKSMEFDDDKKKKKIVDIKGYAVNNPSQDPYINKGDYVLNFEGEKDSNYSTEIRFSCAGNNESDPEVELDENKKKVSILWKGICVSDGKTEPIDNDDNDNNKKKSSGGHFIIRFILIIVICYFIVGMCYNYFVLNKNGIDIIPNVDLWIALFGSIFDKVSELFGRRDYRPILQ
eukprot:jgi/Orpsp1_1/1179509/evm.model.c7180000069601.1